MFHGLFYSLNGIIIIQKLDGGDFIKNRTGLRRLTDKLGKEAAIPSFDSFLLEMNSFGEIAVTGCKQLLDCEPSKIRMDCGSRILELEGSGLHIAVLSERLSLVSGDVTEITIHKEA